MLEYNHCNINFFLAISRNSNSPLFRQTSRASDVISDRLSRQLRHGAYRMWIFVIFAVVDQRCGRSDNSRHTL